MARRIKFNCLSSSSVQAAIDEVRNYKNSLGNKNEIFIKRLASLGIPIIEENVAKAKNFDSDFDRAHSTYITYSGTQDNFRADLILSGENMVFIEFGAGVHFNKKDHPLAFINGYTIGSYGKGYGIQDSWVYGSNPNGSPKISHGTESTMPMFKSALEIRSSFVRIAKEVFRG